MALEHALGADFTEASDVPRVPPIDLVRQLAPGEMDLLGVDHHDVISHVEMRREGRLVLPPQDVSHLTGQSAQHLALGVDQEPFPLYRVFLCHHGRHGPSPLPA